MFSARTYGELDPVVVDLPGQTPVGGVGARRRWRWFRYGPSRSSSPCSFLLPVLLVDAHRRRRRDHHRVLGVGARCWSWGGWLFGHSRRYDRAHYRRSLRPSAAGPRRPRGRGRALDLGRWRATRTPSSASSPESPTRSSAPSTDGWCSCTTPITTPARSNPRGRFEEVQEAYAQIQAERRRTPPPRLTADPPPTAPDVDAAPRRAWSASCSRRPGAPASEPSAPSAKPRRPHPSRSAPPTRSSATSRPTTAWARSWPMRARSSSSGSTTRARSR